MNIKDLRKEIDEIDQQIIQAIKKRFDIVLKISEYKKTHKLNITDSQRTNQVIENNRKFAQELNLDEDLIESIFTHIIESSIEYQTEAIKQA